MTLTEPDFDQIRTIVQEEVKEEVRTQLTSFRSDIFGRIDDVMRQLNAIRESLSILVPKATDHEERITSLEEIHPSGQHSAS